MRKYIEGDHSIRLEDVYLPREKKKKDKKVIGRGKSIRLVEAKEADYITN